MPKARRRVSNYFIPVSGHYVDWNNGNRNYKIPRTTMTYFSRVCDDVVGNFPNANALDSTSFTSSVYTMNGKDEVMWSGELWQRKAAFSCPVLHAPSVLPVSGLHVAPGITEANNVAIRTMAATNPGAADVSIPTFAAELKDIPGTIRTWGRKLLSLNGIGVRGNPRKKLLYAIPPPLAPDGFFRGWTKSEISEYLARKGWTGSAEAFITQQWVINPMVSDLRKMILFTKLVDDRFRKLSRLASQGSIKGRAFSSASEHEAESALVIESQVGWVTARRVIKYSRNVWGSCSWTTSKTGPNATNLPSSNEELRLFSERLVKGVSLSGAPFEALSTAWELLPWSWFVDWFANVGGSIRAANNAVHANPGNFCVMCTRSARSMYSVTDKPDWMTISGIQSEHTVNKWRLPVPIVQPFSISALPIINGRKWSILGSLAALRTKR